MADSLHELLDSIRAKHFHSHRGQAHSTLLSRFILADLTEGCPSFRADIESGVVRSFNILKTPGARGRRADLLVAEPLKGDTEHPDLTKLRLCVENKSVVTAHRNATSRYDDLREVVDVLHREQPDAIFVATALVGVSPRYLNVNDGVKKCCKIWGTDRFGTEVLRRLSTGDQTLWDDFPEHISPNKPGDPEHTVAQFQGLPTRNKTQTHRAGYDFLLIIPVDIDNVNPPKLCPPGTLGIDAMADYNAMIQHVCGTYTMRFH